MTEKELKKRKYNRILLDVVIDNIKEMDIQISAYKMAMDDINFNESNEVEQLYDKIRTLGLDLFYVGR